MTVSTRLDALTTEGPRRSAIEEFEYRLSAIFGYLWCVAFGLIVSQALL